MDVEQGSVESAASAGLTVPAMRGRQGGRNAYFVMMRLPEFTEQIPVITDTPKRELKEQRVYDPKHAREIAEYLIGVRDYVLPPVMVTIDTEPTWKSVVDGLPFGYVTITPGTKRRITDGMHRGDGLGQANGEDDDGKLAEDVLGVWIVVESNIDRRRNMFSDVNRNQKSVPKSLAISFDSRDAYAIALRALIESHPMLTGVVEEERSRAPRGSGKLFTMAALREALETFVGSGMTDPETIEENGEELFNTIWTARPELHGLAGDPASIDELRKASIIASSTTIKVIAAALAIGRSRGKSLAEMTGRLATVSFDPNSSVWTDVGFTSAGVSTPSSRNQEVRGAILALADILAPRITVSA